MFVRSVAVGASALAILLSFFVAPLTASAQSTPAQSGAASRESSDLDAFMEKVLARRDVNRKVLNDYVLDEREVFQILGPGRARLHRTSREYTWFVRDGIHVRSPLRFEGVGVGDEARVAYEERWLQREKERIARKQKREQEKAAGRPEEEEPTQVTLSTSGITTNALPTEPRFVSEAYFMDFKFEPGNYLLAGRETLAGQEVLKIEYYPTKLFGGKDDEKTPREMRRDRGRDDRDRQLEQDIERKMNRTSLVTLWVDPKEHQIVKYTFDNVWLDFLPGAWLVRVDEMRASMTMFQPFEGVWLPQGIEIAAGITLANGSFEAAYERAFSDYRQAEVKSRIRVPKEPPSLAPVPQGDRPLKGPVPELECDENCHSQFVPGDAATVDGEEVRDESPKRGPVPLVAQAAEVVREIRVHGNAAVDAAAVLRIAGLEVGATLDGTLLADAERRLRDSGHFETIEVRKRYRSLTDPTDVAIVLLVHEKTGVRTDQAGTIERPVLDRINNRIMFLPILNFADGYGFTYGARFSTVDLLGAGERLSLPLTWGGTRRIALEADRPFKSGPLTRILASASLWQRENPGFALDPADDDDSTTERRTEFRARAERNFAQLVTLGAETTRADVDFGPLPSASQWTIGADAALDTRANPAFPANAVYLGAGWNALRVEGLPDPINRFTLDGRGYLRLIGQPVLAGRVQYFTADADLPLYERYLVGGSSSLRGFRTGSFNGNKALVSSAELRIPLTSVVSGGKLGVTIFADAAKIGDGLVSLEDARWNKSAGAGVFLIASIFRVNLDVGRQLRDGGSTRIHLSSGFAF